MSKAVAYCLAFPLIAGPSSAPAAGLQPEPPTPPPFVRSLETPAERLLPSVDELGDPASAKALEQLVEQGVERSTPEAALKAMDEALAVATVLSNNQPTTSAGVRLWTIRTARAFMIDALGRRGDRDGAISYLQRQDEPLRGSRDSEALHAEGEKLREDPAFNAAAARYGRILPLHLADGAPPESP